MGVRVGARARSTAGRRVAGDRPESTGPTEPPRLRRVRTVAARCWWPAWQRNTRKTSRWCAPSCDASTSRSVIVRSVGAVFQGRHRLQTSDALGAASVQLGPAAVALVVQMHTQLGVPLEKVAHLLRTQFGITVTPAGLARVLHRTARQAAPTYSALCRQVRNSPVVTPDETGWRVGAVRHWLWAFATPTTTVYAIRPGRGFDDAATVLGTDFSGVLVRDGWAPYRRFTEALHQTCLAHLLRRTRQLREDHPRSRWAGCKRSCKLPLRCATAAMPGV